MPDQYPVHEPKEGTAWESVDIGNGKSLSLYPFTRYSIRYLYEHALTKGQQTPRYIIRDIIEPFVGDVLRDRSAFPCDGDYCRPLLGYDQSLPELINNQISGQKEQDRMLRFLSVWGNGRPEISVDVEPRQISGIPETYLKEFGLPLIHFDRTAGAGSQQQPAQVVPVPGKTAAQVQPVSDDKRQRYEAAYALLQRWRAGEVVDFSVTTGAVGVLNLAMGILNDYAWSAINWQDWGVTADHEQRVKKARRNLSAWKGRPAAIACTRCHLTGTACTCSAP